MRLFVLLVGLAVTFCAPEIPPLSSDPDANSPDQPKRERFPQTNDLIYLAHTGPSALARDDPWSAFILAANAL